MITSSKQYFDASLTKTDKSVENMNQFMLQEDPSPILKFVPKQTRTFGVNTSRLIVFDNSIELILPITHLISSAVKSKNGSKRNIKIKQQESEDGLDEQISVPYRSTKKEPINNYHSESKNHSSHNKVYKSRQVKNWEMKGIKNPQKMQKVKPSRKESKLQQLINQNMRNMQKSENMIMESRKINHKLIENKKITEDMPITKKNFKISNMRSKLSESKLSRKEQIINDAKKMVPLINDQKFSRVGKIIKNQAEKKKLSSFNTQQKVSNTKAKINNDNQSNEENIGQLFITLKTPISKIKRTLIQTQNTLEVEFLISPILFFTPSFNTPNDELKQRMVKIFGQMGIEPQIVSIKKYQDRVELRNKSLFIIWGFDGSGYFGGWSGGDQILAESNRHGVGMQWSAMNSPNAYTYYGQFKDNKREGYGVIRTSANEVYIGCWKNNQRWGWGKCFGPDGQLKYNGEYIADKISTPELLN